MSSSRATSLLMIVLTMCSLNGCREKPQVGTGGTPEQRELMQAFLDANEKGDLQAEEALVNWDGVAEAYKAHFIEHQLQDGIKYRILSVNIVDLPDGAQERFKGYSSTPEKFLEVQYGGSRTDKANLSPIGQKDGRYYIVLQTGI